MSLESRIKRLEDQQPRTTQPWRFILLNADETKQEALIRSRLKSQEKLESARFVFFETIAPLR
jgi:hypothetical protein